MTGVINKLSTEEIEKFGLIINSDYHNSYSTLKKLYKYIYPLYPKLKKEDISIKNISLKVYKEKKINSPKVKKLLSDFRRLLEDFLLNTEFEKDVSLKDIMLLRKYRSLGLKNEYRILLKRIRKKYYTGVVTDINI